MTRFEKITKELTLEKAAEHISKGHNDSYCYEMCEKHTGNRYKCPFRNELDLKGSDRCRKCAEEWLKEEVEEGENKLKPCPFCGGEAHLYRTKHIPSGYDYTPRCVNTSCCGRLSKKFSSKETAIIMWNRRTEVKDDENNREY